MEPVPTTQETSSDIVREIMAAERRMIYVPSNPVSAITVAVPLPVSLTQIKSKPMENAKQNAKQNAMKSYWAKMTPEERSAEMSRRKQKVGRQEQESVAAAVEGKSDKGVLGIMKQLYPAEPRVAAPKREDIGNVAWADGTNQITVVMPGGKRFEMDTARGLMLLRNLKSAVLASV